MRDRLVWGVKDAHTQKKLLAEQDLTLATAVQIAQSAETAEKNLREMGGGTPKEGVRSSHWYRGHPKLASVARLVTLLTTAPTRSMCVEDVTVLDIYRRCVDQLADIATRRRYLEVTGRRKRKAKAGVKHVEESEESEAALVGGRSQQSLSAANRWG